MRSFRAIAAAGGVAALAAPAAEAGEAASARLAVSATVTSACSVRVSRGEALLAVRRGVAEPAVSSSCSDGAVPRYEIARIGAGPQRDGFRTRSLETVVFTVTY